LADIIRLAKMSKTVALYVAVVDDNENVCRSLGRLLRAAGMQPITHICLS
jgi:FixJ family two-component response regulator